MSTIEHFEGLLEAEQRNAATLERLVAEHARAWSEQPEALRAVAQRYGRAVGRVAELGAIVEGLRQRARREAA